MLRALGSGSRCPSKQVSHEQGDDRRLVRRGDRGDRGDERAFGGVRRREDADERADGRRRAAQESRRHGSQGVGEAAGGFRGRAVGVSGCLPATPHDGTRPFDKHVQDDNDFQGDLDDDGHPDQAVEPAWSCGETCNRSIYVMRNSCGHYVGTIGTRHRYDVGDAKHHGLHDLSGYPTTYEADDTKHCWEVHYEFDGTVYKPLKRRECECAMTETTKRCSPDWEDMK
jgi:hypothetical protein